MENTEPSSSPPVPTAKDCFYTPFYCEENVYHLLQQPCFAEEHCIAHACFISNSKKAVPIFTQKVSSKPGGLVIWDYHVIALIKWHGRGYVYDFDSTLPFPCDFLHYCKEAFRRPELPRLFRIVPKDDLFKHFASDRSHMRSSDGGWQQPPPPTPIITTAAETMNLLQYIDMNNAQVPGQVVDLDALISVMSLE